MKPIVKVVLIILVIVLLQALHILPHPLYVLQVIGEWFVYPWHFLTGLLLISISILCLAIATKIWLNLFKSIRRTESEGLVDTNAEPKETKEDS
jgi:hypothetical protein